MLIQPMFIIKMYCRKSYRWKSSIRKLGFKYRDLWYYQRNRWRVSKHIYSYS